MRRTPRKMKGATDVGKSMPCARPQAATAIAASLKALGEATETAALIRRVAAKRTVLMVEHNLSVVADLCDTITVLTPASCASRAMSMTYSPQMVGSL